MSIQSLKIVKRWFKNNFVEEKDWDAIANPLQSWSARVDNNLKQIGLDLNSDTYDFNNNGKATQSSAVIPRIDALEASTLIGTSNLSLDVTTDTSIIKLVSGDGTDLSSANIGQCVFNSTSSTGVVQKRNITANQSVTLTGCDWGFTSDLTDQVLWVVLLDNGTATPTLGVTVQGGRSFITAGDTETAQANVTSNNKVLLSDTVDATNNIQYVGYVLANFDYTGGASEKLWTVQTGQGDVNIGPVVNHMEGTVVF